VEASVKIKQIRNATLIVEYAGKRFLVDPMLAEKGAYPAFPGTPNGHLSNPAVELTTPVSELLDVNAVIVTHTHLDHWDDVAKSLVPKELPIFVQNEKDAAEIRDAGFADTRLLTENAAFDGITLIRTGGRHGTDKAYAAIGEMLGGVSGVVFQHPREKTLYVAGDTIWNQDVEETLKRHAPDVVVLNCGDVQAIGLGSLIMNKEDVHQVYQAAPGATIVASHMEATNHAMLSREELRAFLGERGMTERVLVPEDGEALSF
jgi:L-ascorbate metabolism protein UlaG (beta-lactamase superfamily)